ncbi:protein of unknown function [Kyrpidia spormannii]|uniref:Uncharacterized protein n=1 Tax=Kyrpidia spormannii TaxID=2055160 RepID=A0A6F9ECI9_9BACL|nr:protein of unknown function [Kyrpidia spormannii]
MTIDSCPLSGMPALPAPSFLTLGRPVRYHDAEWQVDVSPVPAPRGGFFVCVWGTGWPRLPWRRRDSGC